MAKKASSPAHVADECRFRIEGRCHCNPPIATFAGFEFPMVDDDCWCGKMEVKNGNTVVEHS